MKKFAGPFGPWRVRSLYDSVVFNCFNSLIFRRPPRASEKLKSYVSPYSRPRRSVSSHQTPSKISNPSRRFCLLGLPKPPNDFLVPCCAVDASKTQTGLISAILGSFFEASWEQFYPKFTPEIEDARAILRFMLFRWLCCVVLRVRCFKNANSTSICDFGLLF